MKCCENVSDSDKKDPRTMCAEGYFGFETYAG